MGRRALVSDDGCTRQAELYRLGTSRVCFRGCLFHKRLPFPSEPGPGQPFLLCVRRGWSYVHIARTRPRLAEIQSCSWWDRGAEQETGCEP